VETSRLWVAVAVGAMLAGAWPAPAQADVGAGEPTVAAGAAHADPGFDDPERRLLVRWEPGSDPEARRRALTQAGVAASVRPQRLDPLTVAVPLPDLPAREIAALARRIGDHDLVAVAEPDRAVEVTMAVDAGVMEAHEAPAPSDPLFAEQWALHNTGQPIGGGVGSGTPGVDIGVLEAWRTTRGGPQVKVAVIDAAVDASHPDLAGAVATQVQTVAPGGPPPAVAAHGTAVAGIIGARSNDGFGITGVAPQAAIVAITAFETIDGNAGKTSVGAIVAALEVAVDSGADVINASWTGTVASPLLRASVAAVPVPIVAAAGNEGATLIPSSAVFPAAYDLPNVVAVTSIGPTGAVPSFANVGEEVVDIAAPGVGILAPVPDGGHRYVTGTSFSVPHVTGALALAASVAPYATTRELIDALSWTSAARPELAGTTGSGGMLDAAALVRGVQRPVCRPDRTSPARFHDVAGTNVHRSGIDCLAQHGVTSGRPDGGFGPAATVTRGQLATFLANVVERSGTRPPAPAAGFVDVRPGDVHAASIDRLAELGIARAGADGRFRPGAPVTRGQAATLVVQTHAALTGQRSDPSRRWYDDTDGSTHVDTIDRARDLGLVSGVARVRFDADGSLRRDQMASVLARTLDALEREGVPG
jgi:subtilisin family serine protease